MSARVRMARRPRAARIAGALALGALLAGGCSFEPPYERPQPPVAAQYPSGGSPGSVRTQPPAQSKQASTAARAQDPGQSAGGLPAAEIGWRDFLRDPRLLRLVETGLAENRDLRVAVLNIELARASFRIQRAALIPQVNGLVQGSRTRVPADESPTGKVQLFDTYTVGATAAWNIDFFGRLNSLKNVALDQYLATAEARRSVELLLVAQIAEQYFTVLAAEDAMQVTEQTLATARQSYELNRKQFEAGIGSELSLRESQTAVDGATASLKAQQRAHAQAENALVALIGAPLPADLPPGRRLEDQSLIADIPAGLPSDLLIRRPDILAAENVLRAQNANIGAARSAFFPRIQLTGTLGSSSTALHGLFEPGSGAWTLIPSLTQPIFDAGINLANLDIARAQQKIALAAYEKTIQTAFREVADGLVSRATYDEQIASLLRDTRNQTRRLALSQARYKEGIDSYLSVLSAQQGQYASQLRLLTAQLDRLDALVNLYQSLGGGWLARTGDTPRLADERAAEALGPGRAAADPAEAAQVR
jgi:outer membrane protein, multidrug efflux system